MQCGKLLGGSLLAGVVLFAVGFLFYLAVPILVPQMEQEYRNEELFRAWSGWTRIYMALHPFLFGVLFAGVFLAAQARFGPKNLGGLRDGVLYGVAVFVVGSLPVYSLNYASFRVSAGVIACWAAQSLCQYSLAGLALGWYCGRALPG